jgi:hypothetical protein
MSEHMSIKGKVNYWHLPYRERGFSYCKHCKDFCDQLEVSFNEGWFSDWMQVNCGRCKKAIWVCNFVNDPRIDNLYSKQQRDKLIKKCKKNPHELDGMRIFIKDNKKCAVCKKPTNHYDCFSSGGLVKNTKYEYWCSRKCDCIQTKRDVISLKKKNSRKVKTNMKGGIKK